MKHRLLIYSNVYKRTNEHEYWSFSFTVFFLPVATLGGFQQPMHASLFAISKYINSVSSVSWFFIQFHLLFRGKEQNAWMCRFVCVFVYPFSICNNFVTIDLKIWILVARYPFVFYTYKFTYITVVAAAATAAALAVCSSFRFTSS